MNNKFAYLIGILIIIISVSFTSVAIQGNSSMKENRNSTSNNILMNNTTLINININASSANATSEETAKPNSIEPMNNTGANASTELSTSQSDQSDGTIFAIGSRATGNKSTYKVDVPALPAKNASNLWYVIQAKPHGMV